MKKNIIKLALIIFMLFPSITSHALTTLAFKESSNGVIVPTIHFEEGFVGGIDVVYKISDTVKVKNFEFNKDFTTKKYTKTYSYDAIIFR